MCIVISIKLLPLKMMKNCHSYAVYPNFWREYLSLTNFSNFGWRNGKIAQYNARNIETKNQNCNRQILNDVVWRGAINDGKQCLQFLFNSLTRIIVINMCWTIFSVYKEMQHFILIVISCVFSAISFPHYYTIDGICAGIIFWSK